MSSEQIQTLLSPPKEQNAHSSVVLFLNSRYQSLDDLNDLGTVVSETRQSNDKVQDKLMLSRASIDALLDMTRRASEEYLASAQDLSLLRHSLADELEELSGELQSTMSGEERTSTLLEEVETLHRNMKELRSVKSYVQVIERGLSLSELSIQQVQVASQITSASLSQYQDLQNFVDSVSKDCAAAEPDSTQGSLFLLTFLEKVREKAWKDMKAILSNALSDSAEKIGWPMPTDYLSVPEHLRSGFESAFANILNFQQFGDKIRSVSQPDNTPKEKSYPLQALVHPISLRFKYHFQGKRQTNRLDKPEWYFTHILNIARDHRPFMESTIQRLLSSLGCPDTNAWHEFTSLLLPLIRRKLKHTIPILLSHPPLLAHTIYQALAFDASLSEEGFSYEPLTDTSEEKDRQDSSISEVILGNLDWFETWLSAEKKFAEDQYHDIINAHDAWHLADDESADDNSRNYKPTQSARRMKSLIEQVTDRYSPLPSASQRLCFLLNIQLPLLEAYHDRISSSLDAFETLSSTFVRAVPGALGVSFGAKDGGVGNTDTHKLTSGVEGVQRLCKALLSARHVETSMGSWTEELFFLELSKKINERPALRSRVLDHPLLPDLQEQIEDVSGGTLFDKMIHRYKSLAERAENMVVQQVCSEIESMLRPHFTSSLNIDLDRQGDIGLSQTLLAPVALLSSHLTFLSATLPISTLTIVYRRVASHLAEHILQRYILYRGHFSAEEGKIILAECEIWVETCHTTLRHALGGRRERIEAPWAKLLQAARLTSADGDVWATILDVTFGSRSEEDWESLMLRTSGLAALSRRDVSQVLRRREDCDR